MASVSSPDAGLERSVAAAIAGDAGAFAELVAASQSAVTSIALAICRDVATSEDVAQEVYLLAWRRLGELRNPSSFLPWIRQMTRFTAKTRMRDRGTEDRHLGAPSYGALDDLLAQAADPRPGADAELLHRERLDLVADTLSELPDESREVLVLFHREGRSTRQVASLLGLSEAVVRKRLERGRRRLRSDVLERFAEAARTTAPGAAFTAAVMALTAAGAPTAAAAGLAGAAATAEASPATLLSPKGLLALGGAGLGFLAGAAGVVLGLRDDVRRALDDRERRQLLRIRGTALVLVFAAAVGFAATAGRGAVWPLAIYFAFVSSLAGVYLGWLPKVVERRYLADAGGDAEGARQRLRERRLRTFFGWLGGAVAGGAGLLAGLYAAGQLTHF